MTKFFDIHIAPDRVLLLEHRLMRPTYMSPTEWMDLWKDFDTLLEMENPIVTPRLD
jgi:hypothetical protein